MIYLLNILLKRGNINMKLFPEQLARIKIDKQLNEAGWDIASREEYIPNHAQAVK